MSGVPGKGVAMYAFSAVGLVILAVPLVLFLYWVYCLVDFTGTPEVDMRTYSRGVWLLLIVFTGVIGGTLWLIYGRPRRLPHPPSP